MNRTLRRRMLLAYFLGTALLIAGAALAMLGMSRVLAMYEKDVGSLQEARADTILLLAAFRMQLLEWQNVLLRGQDSSLRDKHWQAFEKQEKTVQEKTSRLIARLPAGDARRLLKNFGDTHRQLGTAYRRGLNAFKAGSFDPQLADQTVVGIERLPTEMLDQAVEAIGKTVAEYGRQAATNAHSTEQLAAMLIVVLALCGAVVFYFKTHYGILVPLRDLIQQVRRLADGDLSAPLTAFSDGELRELAATIEDLRMRVSQLLSSAKQSSNALAVSSIELKTAAEVVVKNIEADSQSLSSLAAAADRMISAMRSVGERSQAIQNTAMSAAAKTRAGNASLRELAHGLEHIDRLMSQISKSVSGFSAGTRGINGISRKVQEIADRTKLLALNASIEAAQAGDRGRGIAIVAEEVRALAQNSARAAQDITILTHRLNVYSNEVDKVLQRGRVRLTASLAESQAADQMLLQALEAVTAAADGVASVVDSIRQQETGIQQVSSVAVGFASVGSAENSASVSRIRKVIDQLRRCAVENHRQAVAAAIH